MKMLGKVLIRSSLTAALMTALFVQASDEKGSGETMKYGMQAVFTAQEGQGSELAEVLLKASEVVSNLDGSILYLVQIGLSNSDGDRGSDKVLVTEVWESEEAHKQSLVNAEIRSLIASARPLIASMEHIPAKPLGGKGL